MSDRGGQEIGADSPEVAQILRRLGELDRVEERVLRILSQIHSSYRALVKARGQSQTSGTD